MHVGITLEPTTKIEQDSYRRWRSLAADFAPRAVFDAGMWDGVTFLDNLAASQFIVSTSVAEGFGMAFLEPWLAGRGVVARRLSGVVDDFEAAGLRLERFYDSLLVPGDPDWIAEARCEWIRAFDQAWERVPTAFRPSPFHRGKDADDSARVDFAKLVPARQIAVLRQSHQDSGFLKEIALLNSDLTRSLQLPIDRETIEHNAEIVRSEFSVESATSRLLGIYQRLLEETECEEESPRQDAGEATSVELICRGRDFFPCRTESPIQR